MMCNASLSDNRNSSGLANGAVVSDALNATKLSSAALLGSGVYLTIVGVLAILGNSVVLMVILRDHRLRNKTHNILLINLAIADLSCLLGGYWVTATAGYMNRWVFGDIACTIIGFWTFLCSLTSMNTLVAICVYRYVMICQPGKSFMLNKHVTSWVIAFTWLYSVFWSSLPLLGWGGYAREPFQTSCSLDWTDANYTNTTYMVACILFCYVVHLTILIRCYRCISMAVTKIADRERHRGRAVFSADEVIHSAVVTDDQQVTRMCFLVVLVFVGVWTPYALVSAVHIFYSDMPLIVTALPTMCSKAGCMLNPLTYFVTNKNFRIKAMEMLCNMKQVNSVGVDVPARSQERFDKVTKEGVYIGTEVVTVEHQVTMF